MKIGGYLNETPGQIHFLSETDNLNPLVLRIPVL